MKCFIIRLKGHKISEKHARDCYNQAKRFGLNVKYFDGINGLEYQTHLDSLRIKPRYNFKGGRPGVYGCFLSHYYLWQKCVKADTPYFILEHDGLLIRPYPKGILSQFDDVLKLDRHDPYAENYNELIEAEENVPIEVENYQNEHMKAHVLDFAGTGEYMRGAYGYIIKPHAAKKLIDWIQTNGFNPADQQIGKNIVDIKVTVPSLVRIHPDYLGNMEEYSLTKNPDLL